MKSWKLVGTRPVNSAANHERMSTTALPIPHTKSQMKCGIASRSRKKTVSRFRRRSSVTTRRMGCGSIASRVYAPHRMQVEIFYCPV
jgi:hypothetical protein